MKKIIIAVLIIGIIIILVLLFLRKPSSVPSTAVPTPASITESPTPIIPLSPIPEVTTDPSQKITIGNVIMTDFYQAPREITADGNVLIDETDSFGIIYYPRTQVFHISVTASPFETVRKTAEQSFLKTLGITSTNACKLNVEIATPFWANKEESGAIYPMSFCGIGSRD